MLSLSKPSIESNDILKIIIKVTIKQKKKKNLMYCQLLSLKKFYHQIYLLNSQAIFPFTSITSDAVQ